MNKTVFIVIGAIFIFSVLGVWIYLIFFGSPASTDDVLYDLGVKAESVDRPDPVVEKPPETTVDTITSALRQLTTKPIAGFVFVATSTENKILYAEQGTGHIYQIDIYTGKEVRLSGTTLPQVVEAVFSPKGTSVALVSESDYTQNVFTGIIPTSTIETGTINTSALPVNAENLHFSGETSIQFTIPEETGTAGVESEIRTRYREQIFSVPFTEISVLWGTNRILLFNKPANTLQGGLYSIDSSNLQRMETPSYGLTAFSNITGDTFLTSSVDLATKKFVSNASLPENNNKIKMPIVTIPEKCAFDEDDPNKLWCAVPLDTLNRTDIDEWYQGARAFDDVLWEIDMVRQEGIFITHFSAETGRAIDVENATYISSHELFLFRNKVDNTLWLYDTTF